LSPKKRLSSPKIKGSKSLEAPDPPPNYNRMAPVWVLEHVVTGYTLGACSDEDAAAFAKGMEKRSQMSWADLISAPRHGMGTESIRMSSIAPADQLPSKLITDDVNRLIAFNCGGVRRILGLRQNERFVVLLFDRDGTCYPH
jgi:hypothetical protein